MMKVDTSALGDVIVQCFDNSTDGRFAREQQDDFFAKGTRLRELQKKLLSAHFNDGTQRVVDANVEVKAVNADLKASATSLAQTATTLNNIAHLVGTLDQLLNVAATVV